MDLLTSYALGADVAVLIIAVGALALAALVLGVLPVRRATAPDADEHRLLRGLAASAALVVAWVAVPVAALLLLVPATSQDRVLRSAMVLVGAAVVMLAAWRAAPLVRTHATGRVALLALGMAAVPLVPTLAVLRQHSADALLGLAAGGALAAVVMHSVVTLSDVVGRSGALLAGTAEQEVGAQDPDNPAGHLLRRGTALQATAVHAADIAALALVSVGVVAVTSVSVLATEGLLIALLGLGCALAAAFLAAFLPARAGAVRMLGPAVLSAVGLGVGAAVWLPQSYRNLRFDAVGLGAFTDPAIAGQQPVPRADFVAQLEATKSSLADFISATDESRNAGAFLDVLALYETSPALIVSVSVGIGAVIALVVALMAASAAAPTGPAVRAAARTSRTGGGLGLMAALAAVIVRAGLASGVLLLGIAALTVLAAGVPQLTLVLAGIAGLSALVVVAGLGSGLRPLGLEPVEEEGQSPRRATAPNEAVAVRSAALVNALLAGVGTMWPVLAVVGAGGRAGTVWEDRAAHAMTPGSGLVVAAICVAAVVALLVVGAVLEGARRLGAESVIATRTALVERHERAHMDALGLDARRAALPAAAAGAVLAVVVGFGLGPAAVPAAVAAGLVIATVLALSLVILQAVLDGAVAQIETGRYGGPGGWAHGGALSNAVLGGALGGAAPAALWAVVVAGALAALSGPTMMGMVLDGTDPLLRWGMALVAALIWLGCWVYLLVSVQPNLEDQVAERDRTPLFGRASEMGEQSSDSPDGKAAALPEDDRSA